MDSRCILTVAWLGSVDYKAALELQRAVGEARLRDQIGDTLLLLEHPHVFTLGRGADERFLLRPDGIPIFRVSRGGQVTYHGPGQLIGYPILKLAGPERDVIRYLRRLEQALIAALGTLGIKAGRREGLTGVWVGEEKIAAIGVGFRRWVSLHGFALNVTTDLRYFDRIVPCGINGCRTTSISTLGHEGITTEAFAESVTSQFAATFRYPSVVNTSAAQLWALVDSTGHPCNADKKL